MAGEVLVVVHPLHQREPGRRIGIPGQDRVHVARPARTDAIERLLAVMGDPQHDYRVIHVTGTNGKGSTTQITPRLLMAHGLKVGTYTSPHLERYNVPTVPHIILGLHFGSMLGEWKALEMLWPVKSRTAEGDMTAEPRT